MYFFKKWFYLLIFREGKAGRKRGRETSMCGCLWSTPYWGPGLQPRHVPWLGIELVTLWFTGWCSVHWATPARSILSMYFWLDFSSHSWGFFLIDCPITILFLHYFLLSLFPRTSTRCMLKSLQLPSSSPHCSFVCFIPLALVLSWWSGPLLWQNGHLNGVRMGLCSESGIWVEFWRVAGWHFGTEKSGVRVSPPGRGRGVQWGPKVRRFMTGR